MSRDVQFIEREGRPEYVVLPIALYRDLLRRAEEAEELRWYREGMAAIAAGEDEPVPEEVVRRLLGGENAVRVWREHRGMTQAELAARSGLSSSYVSQIEAGRRHGSLKVLRRLARALAVDLEDLADDPVA